MIPGHFRYIFFDADDTLWRNEEFFREAERKFAHRLSQFADEEYVVEVVTRKQEENIPVFGYGSKTFMLSMLDAAAEICGDRFDAGLYLDTKQIVTGLAYHEFELVDGVEEVLAALSDRYSLAVATKGDLMMARKLDILPEEILMVGNAVKSDIAPVVAVGGTAVHIPYKVTWHHEMMEMPASDRVYEIKNIKNLPELLL